MVAAGIGITTAPLSLAIEGVVSLRVAGYDFRRTLGLLIAADWADLPDVAPRLAGRLTAIERSEEHTSELQSLMRISYAVFCLKKKKKKKRQHQTRHYHTLQPLVRIYLQ